MVEDAEISVPHARSSTLVQEDNEDSSIDEDMTANGELSYEEGNEATSEENTTDEEEMDDLELDEEDLELIGEASRRTAVLEAQVGVDANAISNRNHQGIANVSEEEIGQIRAGTTAHADQQFLPPRSLECSVCFETLAPGRFPTRRITPRCTHISDICTDCVTKSISTQSSNNIWDQICCPSCNSRLGYDDMRVFGDRAVFERYLIREHLSRHD